MSKENGIVKVIIIDNEPFVIKSMVSSIPWGKLGLELVASFVDSTKAMKYIDEHCMELDFIITDIRMPQISGLEIADYVAKTYPYIRVVIISGYADFTYAQKAIKYNVLGYFIKPLDYNELIEVLQGAIEQKSIEITDNLTQYDILDMIEDECYDRVNIYLNQYGIENEQIIYIAGSISERPILELLGGNVSIKLGRNQYLYLSNDPYEEVEQIEWEAQFIRSIAIVGAFPIDRLKSAIEQSTIMCFQYFITGEFQVVRTKTETPSKILKTLQQAVSNNQIEKIKEILESVSNRERIGEYNILFALALHNLMITYCASANQMDFEDEYLYSYESLCKQYKNYVEMLDYLKRLLRTKNTTMENFSTFNNNFLYVMKYINENYHKNISTTIIAKELNLNANYISQLFKKETGDTYSNYLANLRIEKAKELLVETELSLSEICEKIGYNDYFYFLKIFKKQVGVSPSNYRAEESL